MATWIAAGTLMPMRCFVEDAPVTGEILLVTIEPDDPDAPVLSLGRDGRWVEDAGFSEALNPRVREVDEPEAARAAKTFGWTAPLNTARLARTA